MPPRNVKAIRMKCPYCGKEGSYLKRHIRKYHPEITDLQAALDFNNLTEQPRCLNPECGKKLMPSRMRLNFPRFCDTYCQNRYYHLIGRPEGNHIRFSEKQLNDKGYLYIMKCEDLKICKIGVTKYPSDRKSAIKRGLGSVEISEMQTIEYTTMRECLQVEESLSHKYSQFNKELKIGDKWIGKSEWYLIDVWDSLVHEFENLQSQRLSKDCSNTESSRVESSDSKCRES